MFKIFKIWLPIFFVTICCINSLFAQPIPIQLFNRDKVQEARWSTLRANQPISVIKYDPVAYELLKKTHAEQVSMTIPTPGGDLILNLQKHEFFADGFKITNDKNEYTPQQIGLFYKGEIDGQPGSFAAISLFDHEVVAVINTLENNKYVIGLSNSFRRESFVVYDAARSEAPPVDCLSESLPGYIEKSSHINLPSLEQREAGGCVNVYFELGSSVYINKGGTPGAVDFITGVFNVVAALYSQDGINVKISEIFVWTTPEPYNDNSTTALTEFGRAKQLNFNGNIAQLVRIKSSGSQAGVAWLATLCSPYIASAGAGPYSYAEVLPSYAGLPTYSWTTEVITHEIGHILGSPHTQSCSWQGGPLDNCRTPEGNCSPGPTPTNGGTIMSYCHLTSIGINFNNGFGPQPKALILKSILNAQCITACNTIAPPNPTCATPGGLTASNIGTTGATIAWLAVSGASSYTINYRTNTTSTWTNLSNNVISLTANVTGLSPSTVYFWQVRANCGAINSGFGESQFTTSPAPPNCSGTPPSSLASSSISANGATVRWGIVAGATSYQVQFKKSDMATWTTVSSSLTSITYTFTNLLPGTAYQWRVAANCSGGNSAFVSSQFTTSVIVNCTTVPPTNLLTTGITASGASLTWSASSLASSYSVDYKLSTSISWSSLSTGTILNTIILEGLLPGSAYQWRVKSNCTGGSSAYSTTDFVTSPITACQPPYQLNTTNITQTSASLSWAASTTAFNYSIEYKKSVSSTWIFLTNSSSTSLNTSGFTAATMYDWRVRTNCASGVSGWVQAQFTTSGVSSPPVIVCNPPTGLVVNNLSASTATLGWAAETNAISFKLEYKTSTSPDWIVADATLKNKVYPLEKLSSNTTYDWRVRSDCAGSNSPYAIGAFTTLPVVSVCPGSKDLVDNETFSTAQPISMNEDILGKISPASDNDFYKFSVTTGGSLTVSLAELAADFDIRVYSSQGAIMGVSQNSNLAAESINLNLIPGEYYVRVYGWNNSFNASKCYTLRIHPSTARLDISATTSARKEWVVALSPNPAQNRLTLMVDDIGEPALTTIIDLQGRLHKRINVHRGLNQMDITELPSGFYLIKVEPDHHDHKILKFLKVN